MTKFNGTIDELKDAVAAAGFRGEWTVDAHEKHTFRTKSGGVVNWWPTGTANCQGDADEKFKLEAVVFHGKTERPVLIAASTQKQIFIVHGHDAEARNQLELMVYRLGLQPFVLMNSTGEGKTIIEALEARIGRDHSSDFGLVLMTPDDMGYALEQGEAKIQPRARQNVVLETGMLLSSLTRDRIVIIVKGHIEIPSDINGLIYAHYNNHIREVVPKICGRLREAGFTIEPYQMEAAMQ